MHAKTVKIVQISLAFALLFNIALWFYARPLQATWLNVPPVPTEFRALSMTLGDKQFAYRAVATMLQNFGSTGGRVTPIKNYNFQTLADWFFLSYHLDPQSDFAPMLAALYYGSSQDPQKIRPLLEYLKVAGNSAEGEKWRWLAHAVFLARFDVKDNDLALDLARTLSAIPNDHMPMWARQMPANVLRDQGKKEAALQLMLGLLESNHDKVHPNEVNAMVDYICTRILEPQEAQSYELCDTIK
ncbi:MAG: hypothetical protein ACPGRX_06015 [Bdellovibrionales bacterium]